MEIYWLGPSLYRLTGKDLLYLDLLAKACPVQTYWQRSSLYRFTCKDLLYIDLLARIFSIQIYLQGSSLYRFTCKDPPYIDLLARILDLLAMILSIQIYCQGSSPYRFPGKKILGSAQWHSGLVLVSRSYHPGSISATGRCAWEIRAPVKLPCYPSSLSCGDAGVQRLLHASFLISKFRCLMGFIVCIKDHINIIIYYYSLYRFTGKDLLY